MSVFARSGSVVLLLGLMLAAPAALAESSPAWTDPPVRGNAAPQAPAESKPAAAKPAETKPSDTASETKPADGKAAAGNGSPAAAPAAATPAPRAAPTRQADARAVWPSRRALVRPRTVAQSPALHRPGYRARLAAGPRREARRHLAERRRIAQREARFERPERGRSAGLRRHHEPEIAGGPAYLPGRIDPYDGRFEPSFAPRRRLAGWGVLIDDDDRAQRIAQARATGYRVMRMRTYTFPDGSRMRDLMPLDGGPDDLD